MASGAGAACRSSVELPPQPTTTNSTSAGAPRARLRPVAAVVVDQTGEPRARVERRQLLEAADRLAVDEDLRDGPATGSLHEVGAQRRGDGHVRSEENTSELQ